MDGYFLAGRDMTWWPVSEPRLFTPPPLSIGLYLALGQLVPASLISPYCLPNPRLGPGPGPAQWDRPEAGRRSANWG